MKFLKTIDIEKIYPKGLSNAICHRSGICQGPNSDRSKTGPITFAKPMRVRFISSGRVSRLQMTALNCNFVA